MSWDNKINLELNTEFDFSAPSGTPMHKFISLLFKEEKMLPYVLNCCHLHDYGISLESVSLDKSLFKYHSMYFWSAAK